MFNTEHRKCSRPQTEDDEDGNNNSDTAKALLENASSQESLIEMMHFAQVGWLTGRGGNVPNHHS